MPTIYNIPAEKIIERTVEYLKDNVPEVTPPPWVAFVKTGSHRENPPRDPDWWYIRSAAILRAVYRYGPVGVGKLRSKYGGKQNRGTKPERFKKGSGNIIRKILQQLQISDPRDRHRCSRIHYGHT